jgi:hypothetical protein
MARRGCHRAATHGAVLGPRDPRCGRRRRRRGAGAGVAQAGHKFLVAQSSQRTQALPDEPSTVLHSEDRTGERSGHASVEKAWQRHISNTEDLRAASGQQRRALTRSRCCGFLALKARAAQTGRWKKMCLRWRGAPRKPRGRPGSRRRRSGRPGSWRRRWRRPRCTCRHRQVTHVVELEPASDTRAELAKHIGEGVWRARCHAQCAAPCSWRSRL